MRKKKSSTGVGFTLALVLHGLLAIVALFIIAVERGWIDLPLEGDLVMEPKPPKVRPPEVRNVPTPTVLADAPVISQPEVAQRFTTAVAVKTTNVQTNSPLVQVQRRVQVNAPVNAPKVRLTNPNVNVPQVVTDADLPVSDSPSALSSSAPVAGSGIGAGPKIGRGVGGSVIGGGPQLKQGVGISLVDHIGGEVDGLGNMAGSITIGAADVLPLPKGEPGGRVVGKGKNIKGVFRLVRVKHSLSDWWADTRALTALAKWLNEKTQIKTDLNVEGGAVALTDANLTKSPMLWMTGHDPHLVRTKNLVREGGGGRLDNKLSDLEAANLRRYLYDKQGMLVFDDCGVNAPAQAMIKIFQAQMRLVMPEYGIERIPNDHEVYRSFYELAGPPTGFDIFWWGNRPPKRNFLEGISVGDKLVAMMIRRDYMCAMEPVSLPTRSVHYSPGVYRWATNVVVYSLTTGNIADYNQYVPDDNLAQEDAPTTPPQATRITPTPLELEE